MKRDELRRYAEMGATAEAQKHANALTGIFGQFPGIKNTVMGTLGGTNGHTVTHTPIVDLDLPLTKRKPRRKMSAAARKRISDAVKARWAKQNAKKAGKATTTT